MRACRFWPRRYPNETKSLSSVYGTVSAGLLNDDAALGVRPVVGDTGVIQRDTVQHSAAQREREITALPVIARFSPADLCSREPETVNKLLLLISILTTVTGFSSGYDPEDSADPLTLPRLAPEKISSC